MAVYYYINGKKVEYGTPEYYEEKRIRQEKREARIAERNEKYAGDGQGYVVGGGHGFILGSDGYIPGTGAGPGTGKYMTQAEFERQYKANEWNNWQEGDPIPQLDPRGTDPADDNPWYGANPSYDPLNRDNPDEPTAPDNPWPEGFWPGYSPNLPSPPPAPTPNPGGTPPDGGDGSGGDSPWYTGITPGPQNNPIAPINIPTPSAPPTPSPGGGTGGSGGSGGSGMFGALPGIPTPGYRTENPNEFSPYGSPVSRFSDQRNYGGLPRSTGPWNEMGGYYGGNPFTTPPDDYNPPTPYPGVEPWDITGGQNPVTQWPFTPVGPSPYPGAGSVTGGGGGGGGDGGGSQPPPPSWDNPVPGGEPPDPTDPDFVGPLNPDHYPPGTIPGTENPTVPPLPIEGGGSGGGGGHSPSPINQPQPHSTDPTQQQYLQAMYLNGMLGSVA